jgi:hypothetical protein
MSLLPHAEILTPKELKLLGSNSFGKRVRVTGFATSFAPNSFVIEYEKCALMVDLSLISHNSIEIGERYQIIGEIKEATVRSIFMYKLI